jgi:hypothetical protein
MGRNQAKPEQASKVLMRMASHRPGLSGSLIGGVIEPTDAQGKGVAGWDILASEAPFRA